MRPRATSRAHIDRIALRLFLDRGYAAVTTEELIRACGVSRPTFFRYVASRDALVLDHIAGFGEHVADLLRTRAEASGWAALREAVCGSVESLDPQSLAGQAFRILQSSPGIRSAGLELTRAWRAQLTGALIDREHWGGDAEKCEAAAAMAIGLFQMAWARSEGTPGTLRRAFDEAHALTATEES